MNQAGAMQEQGPEKAPKHAEDQGVRTAQSPGSSAGQRWLLGKNPQRKLFDSGDWALAQQGAQPTDDAHILYGSPPSEGHGPLLHKPADSASQAPSNLGGRDSPSVTTPRPSARSPSSPLTPNAGSSVSTSSASGSTSGLTSQAHPEHSGA